MTGPSPDLPLLPSGVAITSISLRELQYEEVDTEAGPDTPPVGQTLFDMFTAIDVRPPDFVQVTLKVNVRTNPKEKPIKLLVVVSGVFRRAPSVTIEQFAEFLRSRSQHILFPYVREVVSSITVRGVTGALYINPVVLEPFMTLEEMKAQIAALEPPTANELARVATG
jgi:preprotein translocase subunit SecB